MPYLLFRLICRSVLVLTVLVLGIALAACGAAPSAGVELSATPAALLATEIPAETPTPSPTADPFAGEGPWVVTFSSASGIDLHGIVYGKGTIGVVLAPMYPGEQAGWAEFAETAAAQGFRVLTFDFQGYGESAGERDFATAPDDLRGAVDFIKAQGAEKVVVIGAGQGGLAAVRVASQTELAGVVVLSASNTLPELAVADAELAALAVPSLWIGTRQDLMQNVEEMADKSGSADKSVWVYEGLAVHGTYLLQGAERGDLERRLLEFVTRVTMP